MKKVILSIALALSTLLLVGCNAKITIYPVKAGLYYSEEKINVNESFEITSFSLDLDYLSKAEYDELDNNKFMNKGATEETHRYLSIKTYINLGLAVVSADGVYINTSRYQFKLSYNDNIYNFLLIVKNDSSLALQIGVSEVIDLIQD